MEASGSESKQEQEIVDTLLLLFIILEKLRRKVRNQQEILSVLKSLNGVDE